MKVMLMLVAFFTVGAVHGYVAPDDFADIKWGSPSSKAIAAMQKRGATLDGSGKKGEADTLEFSGGAFVRPRRSSHWHRLC